MIVAYSRPLSVALRRTRAFLFAPFDLMRWIAVGFTAWLAKLSDGDWWGSGANFSDSIRVEDGPERAFDYFEHTYQAVAASVLLTLLVLGGLLVVITVSILLLWVSSRARFVFLDNLVRDTSEIKEPWARFRDAGWSLFLWRLGFGVLSFVLVGMVVVIAVLLLIPFFRDEVYDSRMWITIAFAGGLVVVLTLLAKFVDLLLGGFVVPVMYRTGLPVTRAWSRFLPLLRERLLEFVLFGLLTLAIHVGVFVVVAVAGLLTCCVGFLLLGFPYLNAVLLLPVLVFFRYFPVEFLNQFGEEFFIDLGPDPADGDGPSPAESA